MSNFPLLMIQWAAVTTCLSVMREPPQCVLMVLLLLRPAIRLFLLLPTSIVNRTKCGACSAHVESQSKHWGLRQDSGRPQTAEGSKRAARKIVGSDIKTTATTVFILSGEQNTITWVAGWQNM